MSLSHEELLLHILDELEFLIADSAVIDEARFMGDGCRQRAYARSLEIIGEASKQVPEAFKAEHPEIEWRAMARMRDKLIHHYFGVDYSLVWNTVRCNLPGLRKTLGLMLGR